MAKTRGSTRSTVATAERIARDGADVRARIRDLTVRSLRSRRVSSRDLSRVVDQVLEGTRQGIHDSIPQSQRSVLKQVLEGLGEAAEIAAKSGAAAVREARERGSTLARKDAARAARGVKDAHEEFLDAAGTFARRLSGELREEMEDLVARARRAGPGIKSAAERAVSATDGRLMELGGEAARTGVAIARRALGGLMLATSGVLEGLGQSIAPPAARKTSKARPTARSAQRPAKKPPSKRRAPAKRSRSRR